MNEEERRFEILKAEAAIRELAGQMLEANEKAKQAEKARETLEAAIRSLAELSKEIQALAYSQKIIFNEERDSLNQAKDELIQASKNMESLDRNNKNELLLALREAIQSLLKDCENLDGAQRQLRETAEGLNYKIEKYPERFYELLDKKKGESDRKLDGLDKELKDIEKNLDIKLETFSQDIRGISDKVLYMIGQNEVSNKEILSTQQLHEELPEKLVDQLNKKIMTFEREIHDLFESVEGDIIVNSKELMKIEIQISKLNRLAMIVTAIGSGFGVALILLLTKALI